MGIVTAREATTLIHHLKKVLRREAVEELLNFRDFHVVLTRLRLAELFTPTAGVFQWSNDITAHCSSAAVPCPVLCVDYNLNLVQPHYDVSQRKDFFFNARRPLAE